MERNKEENLGSIYISGIKRHFVSKKKIGFLHNGLINFSIVVKETNMQG